MNFKAKLLLLLISVFCNNNIFYAKDTKNKNLEENIEYGISNDKKSNKTKSVKEKSMEFKVAYVNINKIITFDPNLLPNSSQEWKKHYSLFQSKLEPVESELKDLQSKFEKGGQEFESLQKSGIASNEALQKKYEEVAKLEMNLRKRIQERDMFAQEEFKKIQAHMSPKIEKAIREIRLAKNYSMVIRSEFVMDADRSLDITEDVLNLMNKSYQEEEAKKAAEQKAATKKEENK